MTLRSARRLEGTGTAKPLNSTPAPNVGPVSLVERYRAGDRRHPFRNDVLGALTLLVLSFAIAKANETITPIRAWPVAMMLAVTVALMVRRRFTYSALAVVFTVAIWTIYSPNEGTQSLVAAWTMLYTAGTTGNFSAPSIAVLRSERRVRILARTAAVASVVIATSIALFTGRLDDPLNPAPGIAKAVTLAIISALLGSAWFIGDLVRERRTTEEELQHKNDELVRQRAENERRAVLDERVRISRELHDVVAHHVSLMGVQAGAARLALRQRPEQAEAALTEVERSSRQAVSELHRLLGFLRQDELESTAPQPTLNDLSLLIADVERAGIEVQFDNTIPSSATLPTSVELTAYRLVQEAFTNALKHSSPAPVRLTVATAGPTLHVRVLDTGAPYPDRAIGPTGHGLVGIRERIAFHGGELLVGPTPEGFLVDATIPLALGARQ